MEKRAIIFSRVSSIEKLNRQNCERQISDLSAFASANDFQVVKVFQEHISGAKKTSERDVLESAMSFAKKEGINCVLFSELSRLSRGGVFSAIVTLNWFVENKINAYFQKENIYLLDGEGNVQPTTQILISALSFSNSCERSAIQFRLNSGRELAKKKGIKFGRKIGSIETKEDKEKKYPITLRYIRKGGYKLTEILAIAQSQGEKICYTTLRELNKEYKK